MRPILYSLLILFSSPTIFAQGEVAVDVDALQQLIEDQNRLLNDQSAQLKSLTRRVAALEGQTGVADEPPPGVVDSQTDDVRSDLPPQVEVRTAASVDPLLELVRGGIGGAVIAAVLGKIAGAQEAPQAE